MLGVTTMITGLDHIVVLCPSLESGEASYAALLGREPDWRSTDGAGSATAIFQLDNMAVELMAPRGAGPLSRRLHALIDREGPGLQTVVLSCDNIEETHGVLARRGLNPEPVQTGDSIDSERAEARSWRRFRLDDARTGGVRMFVLQRSESDPLVSRPADKGAVKAIDHVVVNTMNPDRATAIYGARLGLRLALDRSNPDWDARLMFFRTGDLTIELAHRLSKGEGDAPDRLFGLTWRVDDIEAAHARMNEAGLTLSGIRAGRRAGTRVFTVRDGTLNVPTLILAAEGASPGE
jgi:catechol 2,3-dioxygenase-like lactoylglutathione lyase family enzyme